MKRILLVVSLILTFGFSLQGVAAQVDASMSGEPVLGDIEGLEAAWSRTYMPDMDALFASPTANEEELDLSAMMRSVSIQAYVFDSDDSADAFMDSYGSDMESSLAEASDMGETEITDIEDLDREGIKVTIDSADLGIGMTVYVFADGNTVFTLIGMDADVEAASTLVHGVAEYIVDTEAETDEVSFKEDGTSTGGVFDRMPKAGDDLVGGLIIESDMDLMAQ